MCAFCTLDFVLSMLCAFSEAHCFARTSIISLRTTSERLNPELDGPNLTLNLFLQRLRPAVRARKELIVFWICIEFRNFLSFIRVLYRSDYFGCPKFPLFGVNNILRPYVAGKVLHKGLVKGFLMNMKD